MRHTRVLLFLGVLAWAGVASAQRFKDAHEDAPAGWTGPKFALSQDYPTTKPINQPKPWKTIDFRTHPAEYLNAVLQYCYEGNIEVDWRGQDNAVRKWYHAPWLDPGGKGREFMHGMTREKSAIPFKLHPNQSKQIGAYAVGMYNPLGGWAIGRVWRDHDNPDASKAIFPEGSVAVKLLFVEVPEARDGNSGIPASEHLNSQVPYLTNSFEWEGFVAANGNFGDSGRKNGRVRLVQIDVAVKDARAATTSGWVFGTFNYNSATPGARPWDRMVPVGLMWGNDPTLTPARYRTGSKPLQSKTFAANVMANPAKDWKGLGWLERLNGPIDNPTSACLSCHMTAESPKAAAMFVSTLPASDVNDHTEVLDPDIVAKKMLFFQNIKRRPFDSGRLSLDYSLQLSDGLKNWCDSTNCDSR